MDRLLRVLSILALLGSGTIGGVFFAFSSFVMRALGRLPAASGLAAMQAINVAVIHPLFLGVFLVTAGLSVAVIVLALLHWDRPGAGLAALGAALYFVGTFGVTMRGNVPMNEELAQRVPGAAGSEDVWARYQVQWTRWNHLRTAAALLAVLCFGAGLLRSG